jgi:hypothetical protein
MGASSACTGVELVLPQIEDRCIGRVNFHRRGCVLNIIGASIIAAVVRIKPSEFPIGHVGNEVIRWSVWRTFSDNGHGGSMAKRIDFGILRIEEEWFSFTKISDGMISHPRDDRNAWIRVQTRGLNDFIGCISDMGCFRSNVSGCGVSVRGDVALFVVTKSAWFPWGVPCDVKNVMHVLIADFPWENFTTQQTSPVDERHMNVL